jgi:post-segregation antitoxin (ccd killing protein)
MNRSDYQAYCVKLVVYVMRMDRVNISVPEELHRRAKEAGLNISKLARDAIVEELEGLAKIAALDQYLAELEAEFGPIRPQDQARADAWVDRVYGAAEGSQRSA